MKNVFLKIAVAIFSFVILTGCEKENDNNIKSKNNSVIGTIKYVSGLPDYMTILNLTEPVESWCMTAGGNCLPWVEITPDAHNEFENYIEMGPSGVAEYFNDVGLWGQAFPYLSESEYADKLAELQSGNYSIDKFDRNDGQTLVYDAVTSDLFALPTASQGTGGGLPDYMTKLDPNEPVENWCMTEGGNCLPWVEITAQAKVECEEFFEAGPEGVATYFHAEELWGNVFSYLYEEEYAHVLEKLQSGDYTVNVDEVGGQTVYIASRVHPKHIGLPVVYE